MTIEVECERPKYAKGRRRFNRFEDLFVWLTNIRGLSMAYPSYCLFWLAKDGSYSSYTARHGFEMKTDAASYELARDVARRVGLLKTRERVNRDRHAARLFAREMDQLLAAGGSHSFARN